MCAVTGYRMFPVSDNRNFDGWCISLSELTEQWKTDGLCAECRRRKYCTKLCKKRRKNGLGNVIHDLRAVATKFPKVHDSTIDQADSLTYAMNRLASLSECKDVKITSPLTGGE